MKKMRMCFPNEKTFADGFAEYILDCKARNLRDGTIHHYQESIKQIYKRIPPNTPISSLNKQTMTDFYIALRDDPKSNEAFPILSASKNKLKKDFLFADLSNNIG